MESQNTNQKIKLNVVLCGPLRRTEQALLRRGDVEIRRDGTVDLLREVTRRDPDIDMIVVKAPYGQRLFTLFCEMAHGKTCPAWMVSDPPSERAWTEINWQLDNRLAEKKNPRWLRAKGPPRNEALILASDQQVQKDLTDWTRDFCTRWSLLSEVSAPEDAKAYLLDPPPGSPRLVILALPGVDGLNTAQEVRALYPEAGLVWCCDLDFSRQAYKLYADYFFLMDDPCREEFEIGLTRWKNSPKNARIEVVVDET